MGSSSKIDWHGLNSIPGIIEKHSDLISSCTSRYLHQATEELSSCLVMIVLNASAFQSNRKEHVEIQSGEDLYNFASKRLKKSMNHKVVFRTRNDGDKTKFILDTSNNNKSRTIRRFPVSLQLKNLFGGVIPVNWHYEEARYESI